MNEKNWRIYLIVFIGIMLFISSASGCKSVTPTGVESLEQARIQLAIDTERNRWAKELSVWIGDEIRQIDGRVSAIGDGQRASIEIA